jgi:hypothetical protein
MGRAGSTYGEKRNAYWIMMEKPEGKRPLGKPKCNWEDNIKLILRAMGGHEVA